jgi:hypothetical protein
MSTNPISTQFTSNPIIMQQTPIMTFQSPMELPQNMMGNVGTQPQMMPSMMNPNNEIDPGKIKKIYNFSLNINIYRTSPKIKTRTRRKNLSMRLRKKLFKSTRVK